MKHKVKSPPATKRQTDFLGAVHELAGDWERKGWLHKFSDQHGEMWWELTPLGRRKLGLPNLKSQNQ